MAVFNVLNYNAKDGFGMSLNIRRGNPNPLDNSSVWASLEAAQNYAKTDPVAYVGQILTVVTDVVVGEETVKTATAYVIDNEAGDLKAVGTSPVGDESTITVAEDGTVSLYGIDGLALTREEEDGTVTNITYQPLFVNGKLTWVEPSATTVEGLATEIEGLKTRISAVETLVGKEAEGDAEATGLVKAVADNAAAIVKNAEDITAINDKIGEVAEGKTVAEMISDAQTAATYDDTQVKADIQANVDAIDAIEADYLKAADKTELSDAIGAEKTRAEGIEEGLRTDIDAIKGDYLKASDKEALQTQINTIMNNPDAEGAINSINEFTAYVTEHGTIAEGFRTDIDKNKEDIAANAKAIADQATSDAATYETKTDASAKLTEAKEYTDTQKNALQDALDILGASVDSILDDYLKLADKTELQSNIDAVQEAVDALEAVGAEKNVIATVDTAQFNVDANRHLTLLDIAMGKVTGLADALAGKVDKAEGSRLLTEDEATKLEKLVLGENGEVSVSGKVAAGNVEGLEDWITARASTLEGLSENNFTDVMLAKLEGIETGARVNLIDVVQVNGVALTITDKTVNIKATDVVKASDEVTVANDGTLGIGTISTDKLVQGEQTLILNGGSAQQ